MMTDGGLVAPDRALTLPQPELLGGATRHRPPTFEKT